MREKKMSHVTQRSECPASGVIFSFLNMTRYSTENRAWIILEEPDLELGLTIMMKWNLLPGVRKSAFGN